MKDAQKALSLSLFNTHTHTHAHTPHAHTHTHVARFSHLHLRQVSQPHKSPATGPDPEKKEASSVNAQKSKKYTPTPAKKTRTPELRGGLKWRFLFSAPIPPRHASCCSGQSVQEKSISLSLSLYFSLLLLWESDSMPSYVSEQLGAWQFGPEGLGGGGLPKKKVKTRKKNRQTEEREWALTKVPFIEFRYFFRN